MIVREVWYDGICNRCGSNVYETTLDEEDREIPESEFADYKNVCSNEGCRENKWHYVGDQEEADYYEHVTE